MGTDRQRDINKGYVSNIPELPDACRTPLVHVSSDKSLLFIPIISPWLSKATAKEERFFIGLFLLSTCMPYFNRWFGEVWGQCFGTNTICCGISQVILDILCWHTTYVYT